MTLEKLTSHWPKDIDPIFRRKPEFYCCTREHGTGTWSVNQGTNPWGTSDDSIGQIENIDLATLSTIETSFHTTLEANDDNRYTSAQYSHTYFTLTKR